MLPHLLKKIAPSIGASVLLEPNWERAGQITFKSGKRSYFRYNILNLNPMGSSEISKDKDYAHYFMKSLGYSVVPKSKTFFTQEWATIVGTPNRNIDGGRDQYADAGEGPAIRKVAEEIPARRHRHDHFRIGERGQKRGLGVVIGLDDQIMPGIGNERQQAEQRPLRRQDRLPHQ